MHCCLGKPRKVAQEDYKCSITNEDPEEIVKFFAEEKVFKHTTAVAWL
jgi:hypothetical protein